MVQRFILITLSVLVTACSTKDADVDLQSVKPIKNDLDVKGNILSHNQSADSILTSLNRWDKIEFDTLECPEKYPRIKPSGETGGWVYSHKEILREKGYTVEWNRELMKYELRKLEFPYKDVKE